MRTPTKPKKLVAVMTLIFAMSLSTAISAQSSGETVLKPSEVEKLFPATVYYAGQTAPAQIRNSGGVKFADGHYVLASLVDTAGYSSAVAAKYQGYLITEVPLQVGGKRLAPGAYGFGFVSASSFVVTDLGGKDVIASQSTSDSAMARPRPLQVTADPAGGIRLYAGRSYVHITRSGS